MTVFYSLRCNRCLQVMPQITRDPRCCPFCGAAFSITINAGTGSYEGDMAAMLNTSMRNVSAKHDKIAEDFIKRTAPPVERKRKIAYNPITRIELVLLLLVAFVIGASVGSLVPLRQETTTEHLERCGVEKP